MHHASFAALFRSRMCDPIVFEPSSGRDDDDDNKHFNGVRVGDSRIIGTDPGSRP